MKNLLGMLIFIIGGNIVLSGYLLLSESEREKIAKYIFEKLGNS